MAVTTRRSESRLPCTLVDVDPASESGLVKPRDRQRGSSRGCGTLIAVKRAEAGEQEETEGVSGGRQKGTWTWRLEEVEQQLQEIENKLSLVSAMERLFFFGSRLRPLKQATTLTAPA